MNEHKLTRAEQLQGLAARKLGRLPAWLQLVLSGRRRLSIGGKQLDPCLQLMLSISRRRNSYGLCEPDHVTARARFRSEVLVFEGPKTPVGDVRDFEIKGATGPLRARLYTPETNAPASRRRLLLFLHGGGFVIGDLDTHDEACRLLCKHADTLVLSIEYRLAPEHPYPAPLDDALAAFTWAQEHPAELEADPARISVGGDSAGGNLSAVVTQARTREGQPPSAQLLIYPATDGSEESRSFESRRLFGEGLLITNADYETFGRHYTDASGVEHDNVRVSPLRANDLSGLPPALVVTAGFDLLHDEGEAYYAAMKAAAAAEVGAEEAERRFVLLPFDELAHGFINMLGVCPSARKAMVEIALAWRALLDTNGR
ncbi:MAG: acetyl esterase [Acidobacteriota bacterium]|jgi:acetyl esterase|nr:acetyl esterase [Acidobacteriota bacterium]